MKLGRDYIISINDVDQKVIFFWKNIYGRILKKKILEEILKKKKEREIPKLRVIKRRKSEKNRI